MEEDIRETGVEGLKGLPGINRQGSTDIEALRAHLDKSRELGLFRPNYLPKAPVIEETGIESALRGYGQSRLDKKIRYEYEEEDLNEFRARHQSRLSKIGNGLAKGVTLAGTTFLNGTLGLLGGIIEGIYNLNDEDPNTGFWSGMWNNEITKMIADINEGIEKKLPNYYSRNELNSPWYSNVFTANFLGDKLIKNLGFSAGALMSGNLASKAIRLTRLPNLIRAITKSTTAPSITTSIIGSNLAAINEGSIEAITNSKDFFEAQKYQVSNQVADRLNSLGISYVVDDNGDLVIDQSTPEGVRENEAYQATLGKLTENRIKMGNANLFMNIGILTLSNYLQFARYLSGGFKTASHGYKVAGTLGDYLPKTTAKRAAFNMAKRSLSEGTEEISQKAASLASGIYYENDINNFYKAKTDRESEQKALSMWGAISQGIGETLSDPSSWEEFFIGAVSGGIGVPVLRSPRTEDGRRRSPIVFEGGIRESLREYRENNAIEQELADYMNNVSKSPKTKNYYQGLIRNLAYQEKMNEAAQEGNAFDFKNAEHAQLISDIVMFDKAGRLEDLLTLIDSAHDTSDEALQNLVEITTSETENGKKIGPFIDESGNPMYSTPEGKQAMIDRLNQSRDNLHKEVERYRKIKENLRLKSKDTLSDEQLEELTWMQSQLGNWADRSVSLAGEVKEGLNKIVGSIDANIRVLDSIRTEEGQAHAGLSDTYKKADEAIRSNEKASARLSSIIGLSNEDLVATLSNKENRGFTNNLIEVIKSADDSVLSQLEKEDLITKLEDLVKIGNASETYRAKFKEYITNPEKQVDDLARADEEVIEEAQKEDSAIFREKLNQATSLSQFRQIYNSEQNLTSKGAILDDMESEGNQIAKDFKEVSQYDNEVRKAINELGELDSVAKDAMALWKKQSNAANNLEEIANPNSIHLNDESTFIEDSGGNVDTAYSRFQNANYAVQRAIAKVNSDVRFKNKFSKEFKKPADESKIDSLTDKKETGDSKTSTVPPINSKTTPIETPPAPVGGISSKDVAEENKEINKGVKTQRDLDKSQRGQRKYYRPAVPELHIEASKEGDFRPFDVVVSEREPNVDFSSIYNYLRDNGAFSYVNAAKLKVGDTLGFMIDPDFNDHTIFLVDTRNNQIVGSIDESDASVARYKGLEELIKKVRDEFSNRGETTGKFFATPQVRVSKMMVGRIPFSSEERSLADIPGVLDNNTEPILGIIKNGVLTTNGKINNNLIIKPNNMAGKEGRLYLLIPNAAGTYSPAAVRVKHFNSQEFNLDDATVSSTLICRDINRAIEKLAESKSNDDVTLAMKDLSKLLYTGDIHIDYFSSDKGDGIRIVKVQRDSTGAEIYETNSNGDKVRKEDKGVIYFQNRPKTVTYDDLEYSVSDAEKFAREGIIPIEVLDLLGQPRDTADIRKDIINTLFRFNLPIQINASGINKSGYNNRVIKSNILTSNLREAKVIGSWFTTDYFDNQGNLQRAVNPSSAKPAPDRGITTPVGGTESVIPGTTVIVDNSTYTVDLKTMTYTDLKGVKHPVNESNANIFAMAWAKENFGNSTESSIMTENKIVTPQGKVLDRNTGKYVSDEEAKRIKDKLAGKNSTKEDKITQSKRVVADIYENQKRVDKSRTDSDHYYILEDDGQYHEYSRVHSRLGDNWTGKSTDSRSSKKALEAGTAVDKIIREFFTSKDVPARPDIISESAYKDLISKLTEVKSTMVLYGETFMADNIVLFQKYPDGTRVAGEVDILSVDKNGNFKIYDVKTSKYSFSSTYFTKKSPKQRMSTKDYYTLQLSAYQNLFESQYRVRPVKLAIFPFVLSYTGNEVTSITPEKGFFIDYNPTVNVPLVGVSQDSQPQESLPIFEPTLEIMNPENRVLPENAFSEGGEVGYYEKDGKLYTGYLKKIGEIEVTYPSGQKDMIPIHITKVRNKESSGEDGLSDTSEYLTVFPNGKAISGYSNGTDDNQATKIILKDLSERPEDIIALSAAKTQIHNPRMLEEMENEFRDRQYSQEAAKISDAESIIQAEDAINSHDDEFEDELDLDKLRKVENASIEIWNKEKELTWINKVLPQLPEQDRVKIVSGLIQVAENGPVAWGMFSNGIITLSDIAAKGTVYHEAFHAVFNLMTTNSERTALFDEARKRFGNKSLLELEENMAEDFKEYVMSQENRGLGRKMLDFFKNLFAKVTNWKYIKPYLTSYYRMINQGKYKSYNLEGFNPTTNDVIYRTAPNSSWSAVDSETRQTLKSKGWTQEKFNSISQAERDQAVECADL